MKRDDTDFFHVPAEQAEIHEALENWARWVTPMMHYAPGLMIWRMGRSNGRQWHMPEIRQHTDPLKAQAMEKAVYALPEPFRGAIRWSYVWKTGPRKMCRKLGVREDRLYELVRQGRAMLMRDRTACTS